MIESDDGGFSNLNANATFTCRHSVLWTALD